ncbi:hypothetical protein MPH_13211 [Macrophomina phaseolina MS6]|uniref:Nephrocystin 3-like N-terminal domain-containing protein n=1 Tax=Macrophomina phaseolina (strain MS6) TaxID=1126212 RepID=K2RHU2_MACPH|nr:hypothetical protein MPH_13211 [Macrophomina phaseolina MS6]
MTDPLSIAASVAGLALLARDIAKGINEARSVLKGAEGELHGLYNSVVSLYSVLQGASLVMEQMSDLQLKDSTPGDLVFSCNGTFEAIRTLLAKHNLDLQAGMMGGHGKSTHLSQDRPHDQWRRVKQATRWYFDREEVARLCDDLEHHKSTLSLAMSKDSMHALIEVLKTQTRVSHRLDEIKNAQVEIRATQARETRRFLSEKQGKMMRDLSGAEPQEALEKYIGVRQKGTGTWFLESPYFQDFLSQYNASLWLYGIPGAGKSVLSSTIIEFVQQLQSPNLSTAFFFCEHDNPATQDARSILGSIARQLAMQNADAFGELEAFYERHASFGKFSTDSRSLLELIWDLSNKVDQTIVVIDGLDECVINRDQTVQALSQLCDSDNGTIKALFVSRDEPDIRQCLKQFGSVEVKALKSDVRLFVAAELEARFGISSPRNSALKEEILQHLVDNSDGMFQWVKCQLDYLLSIPSYGKRRKALKGLPPDLPQTYERILQRATETARGLTLQYLERTLHWIALAARPLSFSEISHAVGIEPGDTYFDDPVDVDKIICHCSSLIKNDNGFLVFSHFSVKEYLRSIRPDDALLGRFRLDDGKSNEYVTIICLTYLLLEEFNQTYTETPEVLKAAKKDYDLYDYAAFFWTYHARNCSGRPETVSSLMAHLFQRHKTSNFILWAYTWISNYIMTGPDTKLSSSMADITPLHLACICGLHDVADALINQKADPLLGCDILSTPLECAAGWSLWMKRDEGLPRPDQRLMTVKRLLEEENVAHHSSAAFAVQGAILNDDPDLLAALLSAGCPLTASVIRMANEIGSESIIRTLLEMTAGQQLDPASALTELNRLLVRRADGLAKVDVHVINGHMIPETIPSHLEREYQEMVMDAAITGQLGRVKQIVSKLHGLTALERKKFFSVILCRISQHGHLDVAEYLIDEGADVAHQEEYQRQTPLHIAARNERTRLVHLFLRLSEDPQKSIEAEDVVGETPWMGAIRAGSLEILEIFLDAHPSLDLAKPSKSGNTAVHFAVLSSSKPILQMLEARGLDMTRARDDGATPLHLLLRRGLGTLELGWEFHHLVIDTFLPKETNLGRKTWHNGNTLHVLFDAVPIEHCQIIWEAILGDARFNPTREAALHAVDEELRTPLHMLLLQLSEWLLDPKTDDATGHFAIELMRSVCGAGKEIRASLIVRDRYGCTPLLSFAKCLASRVVPPRRSALLSEVLPPVLSALINADSVDCLNRQDNQLRTIFHWIGDCGAGFPFKQVSELLLTYPVDLTIKDRSGCIALQTAAASAKENVEFLRCLMERTNRPVLETRLSSQESILHQICSKKKEGIEELISKYLSDISTSTVRDEFGSTPIMRTVSVVSNPSLVARLIENAGDNIHARDNAGLDLMHHACCTGAVAFVEALVRHGAKVDEPRGLEAERIIPILEAARCGNKECVQVLLDSGANPYLASSDTGMRLHHYAVLGANDQLQQIVETLPDFDYNEQSVYGNIDFFRDGELEERIRLSRPGAIHIAAANSRPATLRWLLRPERRPRNIDQETDEGHTALFIAAYCGHVENCRTLVNAGADVLKSRLDGCTAFHVACQFNRSEVCNYLLTINEELASKPSKAGTPLEIATRNGYLRTVRLLLDRDVEIPPKMEMEALKKGRRDIAECIRSSIRRKCHRETGLQTLTQRELNSMQLLQACTQDTEMNLLNLLSAGVNPNKRLNGFFDTALHIASRRGWKTAAERLVAEGADVDARTHMEETPIFCAAFKSRWDCVKTLHKLGASLHSTGYTGISILYMAAEDGNYDMLAYLLNNGCDATVTTNNGVSPLMVARNEDCIELLLRSGCDAFQTSLLHSSAISHRSNIPAGEALRILLSERPAERMFGVIDLFSLLHRGTPLYIAAFCGADENVEVLIEYGADVNLPGGLFGTPYQAAFKQGHVKTLRILAENGAKPCMVIRDGGEHAAWFWEHGGQFSFPSPNGAWVPMNLPLQSVRKPKRIKANDARKGRYWEHGYRFSFPDTSGAWVMA